MATATDTFTRADTTANLGADWTQPGTAGFRVLSNQAVPATTFGTVGRHVTAMDAVTHYAELRYAATIAGTSVFVGPAVQMPVLASGLSATPEFYIFTVSGSSLNVLSIRRKDAGVSTQTALGANVTFAVTLPATLRLESTDTELIGYVDGVERIRRAKSLAVLADTTQSGVGVYSTGNASVAVDDFAAADTSTADTIAPSVPANLRITAVGATTADLAWDASTDNVGVTGYEVTVTGPI